MRDPERLSSGNGISDFERELLDAGKKETMPAAMREQMERALGFSLAGMPAGPVRPSVEAATGVKASAMLWISAGVVVLAVVGGIVGARLGSRLFPPHAVAPSASPSPSLLVSPSMAIADAPPASHPGALAPAVVANAPRATGDDERGIGAVASPARRRVALAGSAMRSRARAAASSRLETTAGGHDRRSRASASSSAKAAASTPAQTPAPATIDTVAEHSAPAPQASATHAPRPSAPSGEVAPRAAVASSGDLRAEINLIDGARAALRAGETSRALDLLGDHAMHFSHGPLAPEETALRVEALMRLGRTAEARAYARRFVAANPASPLAERMRRLVNGDLGP